MGEDDVVGEVSVAGAGDRSSDGALVDFEQGADFVGDVVDDRIGAVGNARDAGDVDRDQR